MKSLLNSSELPRALVLLGDGDWNEGGDPLETAILYRGKIPVMSIGTGSEKYLPDVALVNVQPPVYGLVKEKINIPFQVNNHLDKELKTLVTLVVDDGEKLTKEIVVPAGRYANANFVWNPQKGGTKKLTISVPLEDGEYVKENNQSSFKIEVKEENLKVLLVESWPRWEYRFLRNALMRDPGVEVHTVLYQIAGMSMGTGLNYLPEFPQTKEELAKFDVVFLGDVKVGGGQLSKEDLMRLHGLVKSQGSGVVFMPGHLGNQFTFNEVKEFEELLPIVYERNATNYSFNKESHLLLTFDGRDHHLTMLADKVENNRDLWRTLPGFHWYAPVKKAKEGARVLAVHSEVSNEFGRLPLLVTKPYGNGQTLFMGTDTAYRWRHGVEDKYHYRFWGQVVRWMAHKRHLAADDNIRFFYTPVKPSEGDLLTLQANIHDTLGQPLNANLVECEVTSPANKKFKINMKNTDKEWGLYQSEFTPTEGGKYLFKIFVPQTGFSKTVEIFVENNSSEVLGKPACLNVLKEISALSKGEFLNTDEFSSLREKIDSLPLPKIEEKRYRLWNQTWWAGLIILLLSIHWLISKKLGLV